MSKKEKLIKRFLSQPTDFTFDELQALFCLFGFEQDNKGSTSGSRVSFVNKDQNLSYGLHRPHPGNIIPRYAMKELLLFLKSNKLI